MLWLWARPKVQWLPRIERLHCCSIRCVSVQPAGHEDVYDRIRETWPRHGHVGSRAPSDDELAPELIRTRFAASRAVLFPLAAGVQASQTGAHRTRLALALVVAGVNSTTLACHVVDTAMRLFKVQGTRRE